MSYSHIRLFAHATFLLGLVFSNNAIAQCNGGTTVTGPLVISSDCDGGGVKPLTLNTGSAVVINSGVTVSNDLWGTRNGDPISILSSATSASLINNGTISTGSQWGVTVNGGGILDSLVNFGTISSGARRGVVNNGSITTLTNVGTISGPFAGVTNSGAMTTFNNLQGVGNLAGPVTFANNLPTNYNIIINSPTSYGQLSASAGSMAFNIYGNAGTTLISGVNASSVTANRYLNILQGFTSLSGVTGTAGTYGSYAYSLVANATLANAWDLLVYLSGPSVANTNQSLVNTASALQGTYTLQNSVLANSFTYDCTVFGANNVCVSAGGRNTAVQSANGLNNTSALLIAAYRPHPNYRIGAYADQNLSFSNPGGTVNLGNNTPLLGLFAAWNERLDGTGTEVKVSAAYGQKNATMTRSVVGSGATASEAGSGSSTLNSQGAQATVKYGFGILDNMIVSPYVGVRYTQNNMGGYTEGASATVTAPLTYSALNTNATTALAGVEASYRVIPTVTTYASAGVETDTNTANGTYSATNTSIGTLTPVNFNANPVRTRPTATLGAYYDVAKNQRLGVTGIYRQEAYQAVSTTTVMATYTIGL